MLRIDGLCVTYPDAKGAPIAAVRDLTLQVARGSVLALLGPSGSGKTSCVRAVAGLVEPSEGEIHRGEQCLFSRARGINLAPGQRGLGFMFQSFAIWPHLSVLDNARFALTVGARRLSEAESSSQALAVLERLGLAGLAERRAADLSGGQQQRLALARILVQRPPLVLLDEPLSNLEPSLRAQMTLELRQLREEFDTTLVVVTHDHQEALQLADALAVMRDGRLHQCGTPRELYEEPVDAFVAAFVGAINLLHFGDGLVGIRPAHVCVHEHDREGAGAQGQAVVLQRAVFLGERVELQARDAQGARLLAHLSTAQAAERNYQPGQRLWFEFPPAHCRRLKPA